METIIETVLSHGLIEFSYQGRTYLIQVENNKGWDYLSLWRTTPDSTCLRRVFFDGPEGLSAETVQELFDQPFDDEYTLREIMESAEIK